MNLKRQIAGLAAAALCLAGIPLDGLRMERRLSAKAEELAQVLPEAAETAPLSQPIPEVTAPETVLSERQLPESIPDAMPEPIPEDGSDLTLLPPEQEPPLAHGDAEDMTQYLTYEVGEYGVEITGLKEGAEILDLNIPETIEGKEVVSIATEAFEKTALRSVVLPETVGDIGQFAFYGCTDLETIVFPENDYFSIGGYAMEGTKWMELQRAKDPLVIAGNSVVDARFCTGKVTVPDGVRWIADFAFSKAKVTEVTLPESVSLIEFAAFYGCPNLERLTIKDPTCMIDDADYTISNTEESDAYGSYGFSGVIEGYPYSTAYYYAKRYGRSFEVLSGTPSSTDGGCGDHVCWYFFEDTLYIEGTGEMENWSTTDSAPWSPYSKEIITVFFSSEITSVGDRSFYGCSNLEEVTLPEKLLTIGELAFADCTALTEITFPSYLKELGDYSFSECESLLEITLPDSVSKVSWQAFSGCTALQSVTILNPNCEIAPYANTFSNDVLRESYIGEIVGYDGSTAESYAAGKSRTFRSLGEAPDPVYRGIWGKHITWELKDGVLTISGYGDMEEPTYSDEIPWIDQRELITSLVVEEGVTSVGGFCCLDCPNLTSVQLPDTLYGVGYAAFKYCESLESIDFPDSVRSLRSSILYGCTALQSVHLPENINYIPSHMFYGTGLESFTVPEKIRYIEEAAFSCSQLRSLYLPEKLWVLGDRAVNNCPYLETINFPSVLDYIGDVAFYATPWLEAQRKISPLVIVNGILVDGETFSGDCIIPDDVWMIAGGAFWECQGLTSVVIPDSVSSIETNAFRECPNLKKVTILGPGCQIYDDAGTFSNAIEDNDFLFTGEIYGYENSTTKPYAESYSRTFKTMGVIEIPVYTDDASGLKYQILGRSVTIIGSVQPPTTLEIPATVENELYGELPVNSIAQNAFQKVVTLESVKLPDSVTLIGPYAFDGCVLLSDFTVSDSIRTIGYNALSGTAWMADQRKATGYVAAGGILIDGAACFGDLVLPDTIKRISMWSFYGNKALTSVTLPESVKVIEYAAFYNCPNLQMVTICNSQCAINQNSFTFSNSEIPDAAGNYPFSGVLIGESDSTTQKYAEAYGRRFSVADAQDDIALGELNGDGMVNASDAALLLIAAAQEGSTGVNPLTTEQAKAADLNRDGSCNASDAALILMYAAKAGAGYSGTVADYMTELFG